MRSDISAGGQRLRIISLRLPSYRADAPTTSAFFKIYTGENPVYEVSYFLEHFRDRLEGGSLRQEVNLVRSTQFISLIDKRLDTDMADSRDACLE